jgi:hypothetical protein
MFCVFPGSALGRVAFLFLWGGLVLGPLRIVQAQDPVANQRDYRIAIRAVQGEVRLDGIPDESFWMEADSATGFWLKNPLVRPGATPPTVVRLAYDDKYLYMAAWCREIAPVNIQTLRRDANYWRGDGIGIVLDPVNQHTFAYFFAVNPYGSQTDGLILGPNRSVQDEWDGRFYAETHREPGLWTAEMAIPLRSLRFSPGNTEWGVNFVRNVLNQNELHTWAPVPLQFGATEINYTGLLRWDEAPRQESSNIALIPYALAGYQKEPRAERPLQSVLDVGLDARIGLASSLNLDLTLNPDFSQAEIDEQPVNLTRFNIRLPERRTFFLENRDVFTNFGTEDIQPFFSRQIGLDEGGRTVPILFGARLTGNVAPDTRVGLLNMQTVSVRGQEAQNFSALALHQQVLKRSILRALITNRQAFADGEFRPEDYNRNAGLEAVYLSEDGNKEVWGKYHHAFYHQAGGNNGAYAGGGAWRSRRFSASVEASGAGSDFRADLGFVPRLINRDDARDSLIRLGFHQVQSQFSFSTYPEGKSLFNRHWADFKPQVIFNPDGTFNEARQDLSYSFFFRDRRFLQFSTAFQQVDLRFPTRFVRGGQPLPVDAYRFASGGVFFDTDSRRTWYFLSSFNAGQFYNGHLLRTQGGVTYRVQPYGSIGLSGSWNRVRLPESYGRADILNVTTRLDITFTRELFWTTFFQYNSQVQVFNINSRLQWRFAPLSDLFIVYTDSYGAEEFPDLNDRTRTLLLKLNYWLNL